VTVFERAKTLDGYAGTGLTLWPNGQKALAAIDAQLSEKLQALGAATQHIEVTDASGENSLPNPTGDPRRFPDVYGFPMRNVRWSTLRSALADRYAELGGRIVCDRSVEEAGPGCVEFVDAAGASHKEDGFDVVVGADGLHSKFRGWLVNDGGPRDAGRTIWRAIIPFADESLLPRDACSMSAGAGKVGFLTDVGENCLYWSAFATDEALAASTVVRGDDVKAYLLEEFAEVAALGPVIRATPAESILERRVADRKPLVDKKGAPAIPWARKRRWWTRRPLAGGTTTLLGDAMHAMIPSLGQGANSSFEGAYRLAAAIRDADGDYEKALRAYEQAQIARVAAIVDASARQGRMVYEDKDEFMRAQGEAQDSMWGVRFEDLV